MNTAQTIQPAQPQAETLLDKAAVAKFLLVNVRTVERGMADGSLPYFKFRRAVRFKLADVQARLDERCRVVNSVRRRLAA